MRSLSDRSSERSFSSRRGAVEALIIFSCGVRTALHSAYIDVSDQAAAADANIPG